MGYMLETRGLTKRFGRGDQAQDAVADVAFISARARCTGCSVPTAPASRQRSR